MDIEISSRRLDPLAARAQTKAVSSHETPPPASAEVAISELLVGGDFAGGVTLAIRTYGPEVYGYLRALHRDAGEADEVFSLFTEALWRSLAGRELRCSYRTWAYAVARRTSLGYLRAERRRAARFAPWPGKASLSEIAAAVRTVTALHLQTENRNRFAELRASLSEEEQTLLMLRVDRGLAWNDLVEVLGEEGQAPRSSERLRRESARLRKRFQALKEKLQSMAREAGIVPGTEDTT
jgi:RNA polymerase sigma-70 factor (ECF subfamily)